MNKLQERKNYSRTTLVLPELGKFDFFGGLPPKETCKIPQDTFYAQVSRPALPPVAKKLQKEFFPDKRMKMVVETFCTNLNVMWYCFAMRGSS